MSDQYTGFFAEFYDIVHAGLKDVESWIEFGRRYGPNILELGSGTGRITIPLAQSGFFVTGIDTSCDMTKRLAEKLVWEDEATKSRVSIVSSDITDFQLGKKFELAIAPCNIINHLTEPGQLMKALSCVKSHLTDTGVFILDNSIPDIEYMMEVSGLQKTFEFEHPLTGTRIVDRFKSDYDYVNQLVRDSITIEEYDGETGKLLRHASSETVMTYFFPREIRLFLQASGFEIFHERGSLLEDVPIGHDSVEMVFLCRIPQLP